MKLAIKALLACLVLAPIGAAALMTLVQQGGTWTVDFDDPNRSGEAKISVTVSYIDANGKKQRKEIKAAVDVKPDLDATGKKEKVQEAVNKALLDSANQVGGNALASTSGGGDVMTTTPAANPSDGSFTGAKIEKISVKDSTTGEKDTISEPAQSSAGLVEVLLVGDIIGEAGGSSSTFSILTNLGEVSAEMTSSMRKLDVIDLLREGLAAQGAQTWADYDRDAILVYLDGDVLTGIGAGCTDRGLSSVCTVIAQ
jgi:hypothetical protein